VWCGCCILLLHLVGRVTVQCQPRPGDALGALRREGQEQQRYPVALLWSPPRFSCALPLAAAIQTDA